jgi:hypothetical protein
MSGLCNHTYERIAQPRKMEMLPFFLSFHFPVAGSAVQILQNPALPMLIGVLPFMS